MDSKNSNTERQEQFTGAIRMAVPLVALNRVQSSLLWIAALGLLWMALFPPCTVIVDTETLDDGRHQNWTEFKFAFIFNKEIERIHTGYMAVQYFVLLFVIVLLLMLTRSRKGKIKKRTSAEEPIESASGWDEAGVRVRGNNRN